MDMDKARLDRLVRNFNQNGLKTLLESPANVRDLLRMLEPRYVDLIDFEHMKAEPADFVGRDFRHLESDLVLRAPARLKGGISRREILIYLLIEHQSVPDRLMSLRLLEYVTLLYKAQYRSWTQEHSKRSEFKLQPVLPIVLYTGERSWPAVGTLTELMELGEQFESVTPTFTPLFLNLPKLDKSALEEAGGAFGAILSLFRSRSLNGPMFHKEFIRVIKELEGLPRAERFRWLELLSYIFAMAYNVRESDEHPELKLAVQASVETDEYRRIIMAAEKRVARTMMDVITDRVTKKVTEQLTEEVTQQVTQRVTEEVTRRVAERASLASSKHTLIRQLGLKFGEVPTAVKEFVYGSSDLERISGWLDRVVTAKTLKDIGIVPRKASGG